MHARWRARVGKWLVVGLTLLSSLSLAGAARASALEAGGGAGPLSCGAFAQTSISRAGSQGVHFVLEAIRADGPIWYAVGDLASTDASSLSGVGSRYPGDASTLLNWSAAAAAAQPPGSLDAVPIKVSVFVDGAVLLEIPDAGVPTVTITNTSCGGNLLDGFADGTGSNTLYVMSLQDNP